MKTSAGVQDSGTAEELDTENIDSNLALSILIEKHEKIDWSDVPGISNAEAGAWTAHLIEAREIFQEGL